jgi:hypothetical protein
MGALKKIAIGVTIIVIAATIVLFVNAAWFDHAELDFRLQGPSSFYASGNNYLDISLYQGNSGNIGVVPTTQISVTNATITGVSIPNFAQYELSAFCQYNDTVATITNLTAGRESSLSHWATIHITPNKDVSSFTVSAFVILPTDYLHPKSTTMKNPPTELFYNQTSANSYALLQSQG